MPTDLLYKGLTAPSKAAPAKAVKLADEGIVTAIVAVTGVVDAVDDLIVPGAFTYSLSIRRPKVVDDHEWKNKAGRVLHVEEWLPGDRRLPKRTKDGKPWPAAAGALVSTMQYNLDVQAGRDSFAWVKFYAESNEAEFSIGYKVPEGKARLRRDQVRVILQVDLFEFSHVLFGAAPLSMALEVKNLHGLSAGAVGAPALARTQRLKPAEKQAEDLPEDGLAAPLPADAAWDAEELETKTAASIVMEAKSAGGWDRNRGNAENLRKWFVAGADGAIPWGSEGDFDACVAIASKHMTAEQAKGYCNLRHHDALGIYPATHAKLEGKSMQTKALSQMKGSYQERIARLGEAVETLLASTLDVDPEHFCVSNVATYDTEAVFKVWQRNSETSYVVPYIAGSDGTVELGAPEQVELSLVAEAASENASVDDVIADSLLDSIATVGRIAGVEGKTAELVREHIIGMAEGLYGKSAMDQGPDPSEQADDPIEEKSAADAADADDDTDYGDLITKDALPEGDWGSYRKTQPIEAMPMDRPFEVETREGVVRSKSGWLAKDSEGYPYPIADDEFEGVYEPTDEEAAYGAEDPVDQGDTRPEGDYADPEEGDGDGDEETVTLDADEHLAELEDLDAMAGLDESAEDDDDADDYLDD